MELPLEGSLLTGVLSEPHDGRPRLVGEALDVRRVRLVSAVQLREAATLLQHLRRNGAGRAKTNGGHPEVVCQFLVKAHLQREHREPPAGSRRNVQQA
jgi:hypothetical protein